MFTKPVYAWWGVDPEERIRVQVIGPTWKGDLRYWNVIDPELGEITAAATELFTAGGLVWRPVTESDSGAWQRNPDDTPALLYHATYNRYLADIMTKGLGRTTNRNWHISTGDVCLTTDPDDAAAYAEVAIDEELVPEEIYNTGITILEVNVSGLEHNLRLDPNILPDKNEEVTSFSYNGIIEPRRLKIYLQYFEY